MKAELENRWLCMRKMRTQLVIVSTAVYFTIVHYIAVSTISQACLVKYRTGGVSIR